MNSPIRLTQMVKCAGCAAKLGPGQLTSAVAGLLDQFPRDPNVIVGFDTLDDAGVYRISDSEAMVQTVDFITPLVDDPFTYGAIAVTNALSDVYAMGGRPITALNIVCYPGDGQPELLREILRGGLSKLAEAGVALLGGHSVDDAEIKFGAAITGRINPDRVLTNAGARPGDSLILTKRLGTGIITTAIKQELADSAIVSAAVAGMTTLNAPASRCAVECGAHACTDVTGFSLMGHLHHMAAASAITAQIDVRCLPILPGAQELASRGVFPGGTERNRVHFGTGVALASDVDEGMVRLLFDPQTSGGLLISVPEGRAAALLRALSDANVAACEVGRVVERRNALIEVR